MGKKTKKVFRLEKDGFGPWGHPKHGCRYTGTGRVLLKIMHKTSKRWSRVEPHGTFQPIVQYLRSRLKLTFAVPGSRVFDYAEDLRFACSSKEELVSFWGKEFFRASVKLGFEVVEYQVPEKKLVFDRTKRQCAFLLRDVA